MLAARVRLCVFRFMQLNSVRKMFQCEPMESSAYKQRLCGGVTVGQKYVDKMDITRSLSAYLPVGLHIRKHCIRLISNMYIHIMADKRYTFSPVKARRFFTCRFAKL